MHTCADAYLYGMDDGIVRGMTIQMAVRLPDDVVAFLDSEVRAGRAPSRAAIVLRALQAEHRRSAAAGDAEILAADSTRDEDDMDALARFAVALPIDED